MEKAVETSAVNALYVFFKGCGRICICQT